MAYRPVSPEEFSITPRRREHSPAYERWLKRAIAALSVLTVALTVKFISDPETKTLTEDMPFLWQATLMQLNTIAQGGDEPLCVVVVDDEGTYLNMTGWEESEQVKIEALIEKARMFNEEIFGPPLPWTDKNVVLVFDAEQNALVNQDGTAAAFSSMGAYFDNIRILSLLDPYYFDGSIIAHELKHALGDDQNWPGINLIFSEGLGKMGQELYADAYPEDVYASENQDELLDPKYYDKLNVPELAELDYASTSLRKKKLFYMMAGEAWKRWYNLYPTSIKELYAEVAQFYNTYHRKPSWEIMRDMLIKQNRGFENYESQNYILQNPSVQHEAYPQVGGSQE